MEFLRDTRHLAGRAPATRAPPPPRSALAVGRRFDGEGAPVLILAGPDGTLVRLSFQERVRLVVEASAFCVGRVVAGRHVPCPEGQPADRFEQCPSCHPLPDRDCVFDPRCADCPHEFCTGPHEVYLAFYGGRAKVGMTRGARGGERLIEQGADAYARVAPVAGRKAARDLEDRVTHIAGVPQSVPARLYLAERARGVSWAAVTAAYERLRPRVAAASGNPVGPLTRLPPGRGIPLGETPVPVAVVGHHDGVAMGGKGRQLFYRASGDGVLRALDLDRVVTHGVRYEPTDAEPIETR